MSGERGKSKGKSIVTIARKLGELLYTLLKNKQIYEIKNFNKPSEVDISLLSERALMVANKRTGENQNFA